MKDYRKERYEKTLAFIRENLPDHKTVLDLGTPNTFSDMMKEQGYTVFNTSGEDLDLKPESVSKFKDIEFVTALQIFEHILNPFAVLKNLPANKLVTSVPLSLWFARAYRNKTEEWDQHFHEFEDWQFDWLLNKAGWKKIATKKLTVPIKQIGIRPLLRIVTPRIYIVYAERT